MDSVPLNTKGAGLDQDIVSRCVPVLGNSHVEARRDCHGSGVVAGDQWTREHRDYPTGRGVEDLSTG